MSKSLKIVFDAKTADYSEIVDSIYDAIKVGSIIEDQLEDGFQFSDVLALLQAQGPINEIIDDVPIFLEQFMQLNGTTAIEAVDKATELLVSQGHADGKVVRFILAALRNLATSYEFAELTYHRAQLQLNEWKALVGK